MKVIDKSDEIIEAFEQFQLADKIASVILLLSVLLIACLIAWDIWLGQKRKKLLEEYKKELNEKEKDIIEKYEKLRK